MEDALQMCRDDFVHGHIVHETWRQAVRKTCRQVVHRTRRRTPQFFLQRVQEPDARAWQGCNRARGSGERGPGARTLAY